MGSEIWSHYAKWASRDINQNIDQKKMNINNSNRHSKNVVLIATIVDLTNQNAGLKYIYVVTRPTNHSLIP